MKDEQSKKEIELIKNELIIIQRLINDSKCLAKKRLKRFYEINGSKFGLEVN